MGGNSWLLASPVETPTLKRRTMVSLLRPGLSCPAAAPTPAARTPQNYEEALRIAETREREVRGYFDKYDLDGSGKAAQSKCRLGSGRARRLRLLRARQATPGGSRHLGCEAGPLDAQPSVLEPAASKGAASTAV
eukprot:scaffold69174_cov63-Phaeocystis_antarctica.AAC.2